MISYFMTSYFMTSYFITSYFMTSCMSATADFPLKKTKKNMGLKHFILPEEHFKANLFFFPLCPPLTHPITHPRDFWDGDTKRGDVGLIKVKKKLTKRFILGDLKHLKTMFFSIKGAGWLGVDP